MTAFIQVTKAPIEGYKESNKKNIVYINPSSIASIETYDEGAHGDGDSQPSARTCIIMNVGPDFIVEEEVDEILYRIRNAL